MDLKKQHENFIINEDGTSILRYIIFCIQLNFSIFISKIILITFPKLQLNSFISFSIEFICLHSFTIFSATILDNYYLLIFSLQILIIILIIYLRTKELNKLENKLENKSINKLENKNEMLKSLFLNILISTTIMILAVDFKVFPRCNAKIEHFGIGLMDAGAICFLAFNSIISPEIRYLNKSTKQKIINKNLKPCLILIMIGLIRLYTIKNLNYQEHISEYGVHMNFFLLLAFIKLIGMIITLIIGQIVFKPLFGFIFILIHEFLLIKYLSNYIQQDEHRETLLDKNKESILTLIGYLGFYLSCYNISNISFNLIEKLKNESIKQNKLDLIKKSSFKLLKFILIYFILFKLSNQFSENISRRNMNMAFTSLTLSLIYLIILIEHIFLYLLIKYYYELNCRLIILDSYTNNGLIAFLISNILTGFINMSTNTMNVTNLNAIIILFTYSFIVSISICFLNKLNNFY